MFHAHCGDYARLSNGGIEAKYNGGVFGRGYGIIMSHEALTPGVPFVVRTSFKAVNSFMGNFPLTLGVTSVNPETRPKLPRYARMMEKSCVVEGLSCFRDGMKVDTRQDSVDLRVGSGDTPSVVWDGNNIHIIHNGTKSQVFSGVSGPVWAVSEVWNGVRKIYLITDGLTPKQVEPVTSVSLTSSD